MEITFSLDEIENSTSQLFETPTVILFHGDIRKTTYQTASQRIVRSDK
jgi:hypothetical protein